MRVLLDKMTYSEEELAKFDQLSADDADRVCFVISSYCASPTSAHVSPLHSPIDHKTLSHSMPGLGVGAGTHKKACSSYTENVLRFNLYNWFVSLDDDTYGNQEWTLRKCAACSLDILSGKFSVSWMLCCLPFKWSLTCAKCVNTVPFACEGWALGYLVASNKRSFEGLPRLESKLESKDELFRPCDCVVLSFYCRVLFGVFWVHISYMYGVLGARGCCVGHGSSCGRMFFLVGTISPEGKATSQ